MNTDQINSELFEKDFKIGEFFKSRLLQLYSNISKFDEQNCEIEDKSCGASDRNAVTLFDEFPGNINLHQSIRELVEAIPQVHQKKVIQEYNQSMLSQKDEKELRFIEDNDRYFWSADLEVRALATLKRLEMAL